MFAAIPPPSARGRLATRLTELIGAPVTVVARVNVIWLDTLRGLGVIIAFGPLVFGGSPSTFLITLTCVWVLEVVAWLGLRTLRGPLQFGFTGGVVALSGPTLYFATTNWITRQPTKLLGSWPREAVVLSRVQRIGLRRLMTVKFPGTNEPARLEILGRRKDDTIAHLFGPVRDVSEMLLPRSQ